MLPSLAGLSLQSAELQFPVSIDTGKRKRPDGDDSCETVPTLQHALYGKVPTLKASPWKPPKTRPPTNHNEDDAHQNTPLPPELNWIVFLNDCKTLATFCKLRKCDETVWEQLCIQWKWDNKPEHLEWKEWYAINCNPEFYLTEWSLQGSRLDDEWWHKLCEYYGKFETGSGNAKHRWTNKDGTYLWRTWYAYMVNKTIDYAIVRKKLWKRYIQVAPDRDDFTQIQNASSSRDLRFLIERNLNKETYDNAIEELVRRGARLAEPMSQTSDIQAPFFIAIQTQQPNVVKIMLNHTGKWAYSMLKESMKQVVITNSENSVTILQLLLEADNIIPLNPSMRGSIKAFVKSSWTEKKDTNLLLQLIGENKVLDKKEMLKLGLQSGTTEGLKAILDRYIGYKTDFDGPDKDIQYVLTSGFIQGQHSTGTSRFYENVPLLVEEYGGYKLIDDEYVKSITQLLKSRQGLKSDTTMGTIYYILVPYAAHNKQHELLRQLIFSTSIWSKKFPTKPIPEGAMTIAVNIAYVHNDVETMAILVAKNSHETWLNNSTKEDQVAKQTFVDRAKNMLKKVGKQWINQYS